MNYDIKAKPTIYRGCQFRSRLEAKWAAFFDLLNWKWEYEPFDLNGYIPDFLLVGYKKILVEVKPFTTLKEFKESGTVDKVNKSVVGTGYEQNEVLYLGCCLDDNNGYDDIALGWLNEKDLWNGEGDGSMGKGLDPALFSKVNGIYDFYHASGGYDRRMDGQYDGNSYCGGCTKTEIEELFNEAGSMVQHKFINY